MPVDSIRYMMIKQGVECWLNEHPELAKEAFAHGWMPHLYSYLRNQVNQALRYGESTGDIIIPAHHLALLRQRGVKRYALALASAEREEMSDALVSSAGS